MADIAPFQGIHYDPNRVSIDSVVAPPYDVLSPDDQAALYERDPDNVVRLILSREQAGDSDADNRYTRAAAWLESALDRGALVRDAEPALYEYVQRFPHPLEPGRTLERIALFVALGLEPYERGVVLPHEETLPKAKVDRLNLTRATQANPEPIYGLYEDPGNTVRSLLATSRGQSAPILSARAPGSVNGIVEEHLLYVHTQSETIQALERFFAPRRVWIADGHHRYETALNYQAERRSAPGYDAAAAYNRLLIGLTAFEDEGLVVLPTHRLVRGLDASLIGRIPDLLARDFDVRRSTDTDALAWLGASAGRETRIALLLSDGALQLTLTNPHAMEQGGGADHCDAWRRLDVAVLQELVMDRVLGISWSALAGTTDVAYTRDEDEAVRRVRSGEFQVAAVLQQPTVTEVRDVASAGDKMPQKSTFFYPKLWSGIILRSLR